MDKDGAAIQRAILTVSGEEQKGSEQYDAAWDSDFICFRLVTIRAIKIT